MLITALEPNMRWLVAEEKSCQTRIFRIHVRPFVRPFSEVSTIIRNCPSSTAIAKGPYSQLGCVYLSGLWRTSADTQK